MPISVGDKFSDLTVIAVERPARAWYARCLCRCGKMKLVRLDHLRNKRVRSCGCLRDRLASERAHVMHEAATKHGKSKTRVYNIWMGMRQRCNNRNHVAFADYGGRGITICKRWQKFENFYADMGDPPPKHEIERINNNRGYSPSNCRWATRREQQNNRRTNRTLRVSGVTRTIAEWSELTGIHSNTITQRIDAGMSAKKILSKEKMYDLAGLELGGKANGARLKARTHCKNGHPFDDQNSYHNGRQRICRACKRDRMRLVYAARRL